MTTNVQLLDGTIAVTRGRTTESTKSRFRPIRPTEPLLGRTLSVDKFINVMLDKRAPGLWAGVVGGPKSKVEHLAELVVSNGLVASVADELMDINLMRKINDKLIRANQRFKAGVITIDHVSLTKAVSSAVGATTSKGDPKRIVARVITELLSRAYVKLNVMLPFNGAVELHCYERPVATTDAIINSAQIANVAEVFEAIELGSAFNDAKEFNPAIAETLLGPLLTTAANRLMNVVRFDRYVRDTVTLVGRYITKAHDLPDHVRDSADLAYLASNASIAIGAIRAAGNPISTPDFDLREAITYTVMRVRELKRYETISLERFKSMYTHEIVKAPNGAIVGVFLRRNEAFRLASQVSRFTDRGDYTIQQPLAAHEAYVTPVVDAINRAFAGDILGNTLAVAAQHLITRQWEVDEQAEGGHCFVHNLTEDEEYMYGLAQAERLYVTELMTLEASREALLVTPQSEPRIVFEVADGKVFYQARGVYSGAAVLTSDPLEVVLLNGTDFAGSTPFPQRPQTIPDEYRSTILPAMPNELIIDLERAVAIKLPMLGDSELVENISLHSLLGFEGTGACHMTQDFNARAQITAAFAGLVLVYQQLRALDGVTDEFLARQVATAAHTLVGNIVRDSAFTRLLETIFVQFVQNPSFRGRQRELRAHLSDAFVKHQLTLSAASLLLLKTGVLPFGVQEDLSSMFAEENTVEIAITSAAWDQALRSRA